MGKEHYIETGSGSFFGEYLYNQVVAEGHFLRKLKGVVGVFHKETD
jgi:hypothetical protein